MSSKKSRLLESSLQEDMHPFAARYKPTPPTEPTDQEQRSDQDTATPQAVNTASRETGITTSGFADNRDNGGAGETTSREAVNTTTPQTSAKAVRVQPNISQLSKWTLYVRPKTQKAIKRLALEDDANYYDLVQEALDDYLTKRGIKQ